ncbi:MAG: Gfo/Idh/MocA family oxidoreductase [Armatimonadetes bacterium]|nr:Gfo/Idh/MocA family oxidoreductase [Armatimonadota bacterium]
MAEHGAAVIGAGDAGRDFIRIFTASERAPLRAVCDLDPARLTEAAERAPGVPQCHDFREVAKRADIDVVAICTPDHLHTEPALAMMEAGKHVIIEKPMATTREALRQTIEVSRRTGRKVVHCTQTRWVPAYLDAKRRIAAGELGEIYYAETDMSGNVARLFANGWRGEPGINYNLVAGGGVHPLDLLLWLVGDDVVDVYGQGNLKCLGETGLDTFDCLTFVMRFRGGCVGRCTTSFGTARPRSRPVEVCGTKGYFATDPEAVIGHGAQRPEIEKLAGESSGSLRIPLVNDFLDAIDQGGEPLTGLREGAHVSAVCIAAFESARTGKPVSLAGWW